MLTSSVAPAAVRVIEPNHAPGPLSDLSLLRISTTGSVDDGKSTLIGRLLYDSKAILEDQLEAIHIASRRRGEDRVNLALLTDGLRAEREQNITIDVAYRYFATSRRKFILADSPGHLQYTRNMITGASTADLAVMLVDVRKGLFEQTKRHAFISALLGIPHFVLAVNKMDLVDFDESAFQSIVDQFSHFAGKLGVKDLVSIPVSALYGDNVVERSAHMPWYQGATLLHHLETVNVAADHNLLDFRFPVQCVIRAGQDFRGCAGSIASGTIRVGEEVVVLPSGRSTRIRVIEDAGGPRSEAAAGDPVVLTLTDNLDVGRGDMIVRPGNLPTITKRLDVTMCWMSESPMDMGRPYVIMHTTKSARAFVRKVHYRIAIDTLHRERVTTLTLNEVGRAEVETSEPLCIDGYRQNRATGGFILVDPYTNATVAVGLTRSDVREIPVEVDLAVTRARAMVHGSNIGQAERAAAHGHPATVVWLTGLPGSGKSTIARALERELFDAGYRTMWLDGDHLREGLNRDLAFSASDRTENIRRAGEVARLFFENGALVICSFISPFAADRAAVRALLPDGAFLEVHVDCSIEECVRRDPKQLYERAAKGHLHGLTGLSAPYEPPTSADLRLSTEASDVDSCVRTLLGSLAERGLVRPFWRDDAAGGNS